MSGFFTLNIQDLLKGLIVAVLAAVLTSLAQWVSAPGFTFATFDWSQVITIAITSGVAYLSKNLLSTSNGVFLGSVGSPS